MENNQPQKSFADSLITMQNRKNLSLTGVEKVYEASETKLQVRVAGDNLLILGTDLSITKIDVEAGLLDLVGTVSDLKYIGAENKQNFFKRLFK